MSRRMARRNDSGSLLCRGRSLGLAAARPFHVPPFVGSAFPSTMSQTKKPATTSRGFSSRFQKAVHDRIPRVHDRGLVRAKRREYRNHPLLRGRGEEIVERSIDVCASPRPPPPASNPAAGKVATMLRSRPPSKECPSDSQLVPSHIGLGVVLRWCVLKRRSNLTDKQRF
jgi:hypothetical protein